MCPASGSRRRALCRVESPRELDDLAVLEIGIIENVQREDLNPMERAVARGSATYDMWGISTSGIAHFKAGWGGAPVVYPGALDVDLDPIRGPLVRLALRLRGFGA